MKKNLCIIWGMLLSLGMFCACSNSDESTEVMAGNGGFLNAEVEYVDLESLPGWLISWISSIEEYENGEQLDFHDDDFVQAFEEATQKMKRIYIK